MLNYLEKNVNPKNRKTGDCSTRAIAELLNITWEDALKMQFDMAIKTKYDPSSRQVMEKVLNQFGFRKVRQPRKVDNTKYQVKEMDQVLGKLELKTGVVVNVANHYVCIKDGNYIDIWNSGRKCVGNYYTKF